MDLLYFLSREQDSLARARQAACVEARTAHRALARAYGERVARLQNELAAAAARRAH